MPGRVKAWDRTWIIQGWLMVVVGLAGTGGWVLGIRELIQPMVSLAPIAPLTALALLALGIGAIALGRGLYSAALAGAAVATTLIIAALFQLVTGIGVGIESLIRQPGAALLPPGVSAIPVSFASAFTVLLVAAAVAFLAARPNSAVLSFVIGIIGVTVAAINLAVLLGQMIGLASLVNFGPVVGSPPQVAFAFLVVGLGLTMMAWSHDWGPSTIPEWAATASGLAVFVTVMLLWWAFLLSERTMSKTQLADTSRRFSARVTESLNRVDQALHSITNASNAGAVGTLGWSRFVDGVVQSVPGLLSVSFVSPGGKSVAMIRPPPDSLVVGLQLSRQIAGHTGDAPALGNIRHFSLVDTAGTVAVVVPRCDLGNCEGFIVGLVQPTLLLQPLLGDTVDGYHRSVAWRGRVLAASAPWLPAYAEYSLKSTMPIDDMQWDLSVWPTPETRERAGSDLPWLLLTFGLVVSGLLPVTMQLTRIVFDSRQTTEKARLQLALGGATDRAWSWEIPSRASIGPAIRSTAVDGQEERVGRWTSLIHAEDRAQVETLLNAHLDGRTAAFEAQYRLAGADGDWIWRVDRGRVAERGVYGTPLRMHGVSGDVSARRRSEEERENSELRFRAAFDSDYQFRALLDMNCELIEANPSALGLLGKDSTVGTLRGTHFADGHWWSGDAGRQWARAACEQAKLGEVVADEIEIVNSAGETLVMDFSVKPIRSPDGQVVQLFAEGRDITQRRQAEAELREVETLTTMGRIAARVAHEINNPLAGIQSAFLLVRDAIPKDHPHYSYVGAVEREIARIADVTRQLYETYRPETAPDSGHTGVRVVIDDAVAFLKQVNRASQVNIEADIGAVPARVPIPESVLRQSVYNLVQNAVEASPQGGTVTVRAGLEDGAFVLSVRDQGQGVPADSRQRIFEPFISTKSREVTTGGMGIGLSLVRRSVQAVGGTIEIVDPPEGGAEFVVRVPITSKRIRGVS
ncbi:MAG: ATP-binding protein [Gemmatimonadota bacterium]